MGQESVEEEILEGKNRRRVVGREVGITISEASKDPPIVERPCHVGVSIVDRSDICWADNLWDVDALAAPCLIQKTHGDDLR